jgi:hypothetical protein
MYLWPYSKRDVLIMRDLRFLEDRILLEVDGAR